MPTQSELETNIQTIIKDTEKLPENGTAAKKTANGNDTMNQSQPMDTVSFSEHIPDGNTTPNLRLPNQTSDVRNEEQPRSLPNLDRNQSGAESQKHHLTTNIYQLVSLWMINALKKHTNIYKNFIKSVFPMLVPVILLDGRPMSECASCCVTWTKQDKKTRNSNK